MREVVIASVARTPFGNFGGTLKDIKAVELGGFAIKEAMERIELDPATVDEVIMGMVVPAGAGQVPGRQASLKGGIPVDVPVVTINKVCGSALKAVTLGTQIIKAGDADIIVAGGMESMSNVPYTAPSARWGSKMGDVKLVDTLIKDGLWCPENDVHMAVIGGQVAGEFDISREMQDRWALRSQVKWEEAEQANKFDDERFSVEVPKKRGENLVFSKDEFPRPTTSYEVLSKLPPVFTKEGSVTAGNAPGINDGAAVIVLMSREKADELGIKPLATIKDYAQASADPKYIATVPGLSIKKILDKNKLSLDDIDLIEINEAFAAVPLVSGLKILGMDEKTLDEKVNVNGSAVAVGHPIGATGARILMTMIYELQRRGKKSGICAICSGMAQGDAVYIEIE